MSFDLYEKQDFLNAATAAEKPVAFFVGSPLSWDADGGVPGIDAMLNLVRAEIEQRKPKVIGRLDAAIVKKSGAAKYQAALGAMLANIGPDAVNRVIRNAVCQARKSDAPKSFEDDGDPSGWHLPAGTRQLAELICRNAEFSPGPILTTNFDPLLSLAIRAVGGNVHRRIVDGEGAIGREAESEPGTRNVVHLHGYWRDSDTLHTPAQLVSGRVRLKASLQNLLRQKTLIVVAYAGWDDVFTKALIELLDDDEAKLDVLWCFREADPETVRARYGDLIEKLQPAIARGRFRAYGGIDCHAIFGEIAAELAAEAISVAGGPAQPLVSPLPGWQRLDAATLDAMAPLKEGEALRYYDGATPIWRHALSDRVPRREVVGEITKRRTGLSDDASSLQLIRAAGGEGKTTLLLQAAVDAAREGVGILDILWRPSPHLSLSPEQIASLDPQRQWLIVADDAENLVKVIAESARLLHAEDRANVDFLVAARDADWKSAGGDRQPWAQWLQQQPDIVLRGISVADAKVVVSAWTRAGAAGLRELAREADAEKRPAALVTAVNDAARTADEKRGDGSFFGGLLALRFGEAGLRAHVREFLMRLRETPIQNSEQSLADALLYVAACHGAGISGLDENVLADLVGVPREWIGSRVVRPLGEEAAAVAGGGQVYTRHSQVAAAILLEAEAALDVDLAEVWARLVKQTVRVSREIHVTVFSPIVHGGPRLQQNLPQQLPEDRRKAIAIAAARADVEAEPERLSPIVDLGRTYRKAGKEPEATTLFRMQLDGAERKIDYAGNVRGYWYEWGVCEAVLAGDERSADGTWLQGLSLSDHLSPAPITEEQIKLSCAGVGVAFGKLATVAADCPYARARRAVADLGRRVTLDPRAESFFARHDHDADALGTRRPRDLAEAVAWLAAGVAAAGKAVTDPFLAQLAKPEQVSFTSLQATLGRRR